MMMVTGLHTVLDALCKRTPKVLCLTHFWHAASWHDVIVSMQCCISVVA